jgi:hypothetical protein
MLTYATHTGKSVLLACVIKRLHAYLDTPAADAQPLLVSFVLVPGGQREDADLCSSNANTRPAVPPAAAPAAPIRAAKWGIWRVLEYLARDILAQLGHETTDTPPAARLAYACVC